MAAENGHLNVLKLFVKRCRYWVELLNNHHQNILHVAAQNGHLKVVRYIQNMFMVNDLLNETDEDGNTPLHLAEMNIVSNFWQLVSPSNEENEGTDGNQAQATPNKTGCAGDEKIEAKKRFHLWPPLLQQRTIEILKAASAKQAKKLEGILEQEDLIIESIRDKRRKEMAACYCGLFYWLSLPKAPLLGASYSPKGICLVTHHDIETEGYNSARMSNMEGNTPLHEAVRNGHHSTVLVLVEANDSDLLVSLNNAGESPLFMVVDARASEIVKTILPKSNPSSLLPKSSDGQTILHRAILRADLSKILFIFFFCLF
ncbi:hypothetical protein AAG906_011879 [Vitis piasezkii]